MKKLGLALLFLAFAVPSFAQYGGGVDIGRTILHRDNITVPDSATTTASLELRGYNKVRADYDVTTATVNLNLQCSNDSLWVSGDSITVNTDSWDTFDLMGCEDYNIFIESIVGGAITVYLTPFNDKN